MPSCGSLQQSVWLQSGSRLVSPGSYGVGKIIALCIPPLHFKVILRAVDKGGVWLTPAREAQGII